MRNRSVMHVLLIYRVMIPSIRLCGHFQMEQLAEMGIIQYRAIQELEITTEDMNWADVILIGRLDRPYERTMIERARDAGKYLIYILDDNLLNLPKEVSSAAYYHQPEIREAIEGMIACSDAVLSPSPLLLEKYVRQGQRGILIEEPAIDRVTYTPRDPDKPVRIGFAGSIDRKADLEMLRKPLLQVHKKYGKTVEFFFFGAIPSYADQLKAVTQSYSDNYENYLKTLREQQWDIGLAPMPDTPPHACKHYNKFCEYSSAGIAGVYSRVLPYTRIENMEQFGRFCENTEEDWFLQICNEIDDYSGREAHRKASIEYAQTHLNLEACAKALVPVLEEIQKEQKKRKARRKYSFSGLRSNPPGYEQQNPKLAKASSEKSSEKQEPDQPVIKGLKRFGLLAERSRLERTTLDEMLSLCAKNSMLVIVTFLAMFAIWGTWLMKYMVTFDAEGLYSAQGSAEWYTQWYQIGRPALVWLKQLLNVAIINPYFSNAVFLVCFPVSVLCWIALINKASGEDRNLYSLVFALVYLAHPVWALMFSYRMHMEVLSIVMVLLPLGMMQMISWLEGDGTIINALMSLIAVTFSFLSFQSFMILFGTASITYLYLRMGQDSTTQLWKKTGKIAGIALTAIAIYIAVVFSTGLNLQVYFKGEPRESLDVLLDGISQRIFGNGREFSSLYGLAGILFLLINVANTIKTDVHRVGKLLMAFCIVVAPFLLDLVSSHILPSRSQYAFVFSCAFMVLMDMQWICNIIKSRSSRQALAMVLFLFVFVPEVQLTTRLLYTDAQTMQQDYQKFVSIYDRAMEMGASPGDVLYIHGGQGNFVDETILETEVVGFSYFEFTGMVQENTHKAIQAMRAYGLNVSAPDASQVEKGRELAKDLTIWPDSQSMAVLPEEHLIVVKAGD